MKVLHLSTYDTRGGAAKAAYRLYNGLENMGVNSQMLVQVKFSNDSSVITTGSKIVQKFPKLRPRLDSFPKLFFRSSDPTKITPFSLQWLPNSIESKVAEIAPDVINLHWISGGLINIETIAKLNKPIVWTLHDMWAFTGGCHYSQECTRYQEQCGNCPQMPPKYNLDLSSWVWQRKAKAWANLNITVVTPSRWLANCASSSSLFKDWRVEVIPYGLDTEIYKPFEQYLVREKFKLPQDKYLILFGAENSTTDQRKGFHLLKVGLENLSKTDWSSQCELIIFGAKKLNDSPDLGFKTHYLGKLNDENTIAQLYAAADVFVAPSLEDNLPNTIMESLACGTPCVAFDIGGMPDMIEHQQNGYLAKPFDTQDLARGIVWVLDNKSRWLKLSIKARQKVVKDFTLRKQADNYLKLYQEVI
ncbi:glycosyltransferase family 4 protein [Brunnivagina elsteri]|uniref:Glycosyl transferase n=1 Tax=Brunnivagina elsteri CCALA 953 TaxID=987040 RepID=A0A2A2TNP7_9CYAN|nr:glycosyltransferase family 4 protein [Calothrix elsteri]PAX60070.1 glycosyl transferase [Calothrix elsteri CCALA 953]